MTEFKPVYGDKVCFRAGADIEGICTCMMVSGPGTEQYQVQWFYNGDQKSGWFRSCELLPSRAVESVEPGKKGGDS